MPPGIIVPAISIASPGGIHLHLEAGSQGGSGGTLYTTSTAFFGGVDNTIERSAPDSIGLRPCCVNRVGGLPSTLVAVDDPLTKVHNQCAGHNDDRRPDFFWNLGKNSDGSYYQNENSARRCSAFSTQLLSAPKMQFQSGLPIEAAFSRNDNGFAQSMA